MHSYKKDSGKRGHSAVSSGAGAAVSPVLQAARQLQCAEAAVAGDARNRLQFESDPDGYLARFGASGGRSPFTTSDIIGEGMRRGGPGATPASAREASPDAVSVRTSPLHGSGLFASKALPAGSVICPLVSGDNFNGTARKVNWSRSPNVEMFVQVGGQYHVVANQDIPAGSELVGYYPDPTVKGDPANK